MATVRILIVEDDALQRDELAALLTARGYEIIAQVSSGAEAIAAQKRQAADLVLMDIHLSGIKNGVDTAAEMAQFSSFRLIYITSDESDLTFTAAKQTSPQQFIEKPINERQLVRSIELALRQPLETSEIPDHVFYAAEQCHVKLVLKDILYLQADGSQTWVYSKVDGDIQRALISMSSNQLHQQLKNPRIMRVHNSYYVNLDQVDGLENRNRLVIGSAKLPISKSYHAAVLAAIPLIRRP